MSKQLSLSCIDGTFAVVRLSPDTKPPDWFWQSKFYSLTKTDDELSIVCEQASAPPDIISDPKRCEANWGLFKVEGPLDFGLTGILHKLTTPLAKAKISLFAVSTFDTDYILVKKEAVFNAGYSWLLAGHLVQGLPDLRRPQDGSVAAFEKDPMIKRMMDLMKGMESVEETFGIVLVSGWVPSEIVQSAYNDNFMPAVRKCFLETDWKHPSDAIPNVYLYPARHLHVTVATLHAFWRPVEDEVNRVALETEWTDLVRAASQRQGWPQAPLQLTLDSAQIGTRAGILLWKELTGGLDQMRICVQAEVEARQTRLIRAGIDPDTVAIPGIIHSTFLRFHELPETPGKVIQENFEKHVKANLSKFFPEPILASEAKLVCERTPYMHIEDDERHVFATFSLSDATGSNM